MEEDTVAHRIDSYNKAVVFTEQPIPLGAMFQVKLVDKGGGWAGSIVSRVVVAAVKKRARCTAFLINAHTARRMLFWNQILGNRIRTCTCCV